MRAWAEDLSPSANSATEYYPSNPFNIILDTTGPGAPGNIEMDSSSDKGKYNYDGITYIGTPLFNWDAVTDPSGINQYQWAVTYSNKNPFDNNEADRLQQGTVSSSTFSKQIPSDLSNGEYIFWVIAEDNASNWGEWDGVIFEIDISPPPQAEYLANPENPTNDTTPQVSWQQQADPDSGFWTHKVLFYDGPGSDREFISGDITLDDVDYAGDSLEHGTWKWKVQTVDIAGNETWTLNYESIIIFGPITININTGLTAQEIDGFGGSMHFWGYNPTDDILDKIFSADELGATIVRLGIGIDNNDPELYADDTGYRHEFTTQSDLIPKLYARAEKIVVSNWFTYNSYPYNHAQLIVNRVKKLRDLGWLNDKPIYLSIQNEPDGNWWNELTESQLVTLIKDVYNIISNEVDPTYNWSNVYLVAPEASNPIDAESYVQAILADNDAKQYLSLFAYHMYSDTIMTDLASWKSKLNYIRDSSPQLYHNSDSNTGKNWQTETSGNWDRTVTTCYQSLSDPASFELNKALGAAQIMHYSLTESDSSAFLWWGLTWSDGDPVNCLPLNAHDQGLLLVNQNQQPMPLLNPSWSYTKKYYAFKQFSKYVKPGYYRVQLSGDSPLMASAYTSSDNQTVVVVIINTELNNYDVNVDIASNETHVLCESFRTSSTENCLGYSGWAGIAPSQSITTLVYRVNCSCTVPDVSSMNESAAEAALTAAGFVKGNVTSQCSAAPAGEVISQNPTDGTSVACGSAVDLVVSTGIPCNCTVPDVLNTTESAAETDLIAAGLVKGNVTSQCSDTVAAGNVISQNPTGSTSVACGSAVDLVVSTGIPCNCTVPDVLSKTESAAESDLIAAGLVKGDVTHQYDNTVPAGEVISQNPDSGVSLACGLAVDLVISDGPTTISVTPPNRDFGAVEAGSYTELTFTVENTGGGTLTGDATVLAPFTVESGGSYSLATGQTQVVTVRFSPTLAQSYNEDVTFTGGGGTTKLVTGTGIPPYIYVDNDAPEDPEPGNPDISDPNEDGSAEHPFDAIQEAIDIADDNDIIVVRNGVYIGTGNRDIDFNGKTIIVRSQFGPNNCIIDCQGTELEPHRGFIFQNGENLESALEGFTITNGYSSTSGGAILCFFSSPSIRWCIIRGNSASDDGGGMANSLSNPVVVNCIFSENIAAEYGGGMYNYASSPMVIGCTFHDNLVTNLWGGGGGLCNYASSANQTLINCIFVKNKASATRSYGGGVYNYDSDSTFFNCTFNRNSAFFGNAVSSYSWGGSPHQLEIVNCILWDSGNEVYASESSTIIITHSNIEGSWPGSGNIADYPLFLDPNGPDNDPNTWEDNDYRLLPGSPCIDAGDSNSVPADSFDLDSDSNTVESIPFDLDGDTRIKDGDCNSNPTVDMGAYEFDFANFGDFEGSDCDVDFADFAVLALAWLTSDGQVGYNSACDISIPVDGYIDWLDLVILTEYWLEGTVQQNEPDDMVFILGGTFEMGDHHDEMSNALPVHTVTLDSFYMSKYGISNQQYADFLNSAYPALIKVDGGVVYAADDDSNSYPYCDTSTASSYSQINYFVGVFTVNIKDGTMDMSNHPMVEASWYGSVAYCNWKSQQEGLESCYNLSTWQCDFTKNGYRLATEAEWEYAARGGNHSPYYRYSWGDSIDGSMANYYSSGDPFETGPSWPLTTPVGYYDGNQTPAGIDMANGYGLYDMTGNVYEWCNDWHDSSYYSSSPTNNPTGPASGINRVMRGGEWFGSEFYCRVAYRNPSDPLNRMSVIGFRIVLDLN